jgi:riboflavin biosynthesis pyrimidine reductase
MQSQLRSHNQCAAIVRIRLPGLGSGARKGSDSLALVHPICRDMPEDEDLLGRLYAYPDGDRTWVRANMVASVDGAVSLDGRSGGLGGPADKKLFAVLRSLADVVLVGSGTARAEKYKPARPDRMTRDLRAGRPPTPPIAVVSGRLDLDPDAPLLTEAPEDASTIVITAQAAPADRRKALSRHATVIDAGTDQVSLPLALTALADLGHRRILVEGGPSLLGQLAAAGLLDELCLTVSPLLAGGTAGRILTGGPDTPLSLRLGHVLTDDSFLFCRYERKPE